MAETFFQSLFTSIADSGRELIARNLTRSERSGADRVIELCRALLSSRGEASGAALAVATLEAYDALPKDQQATLFQRLVVEFCSDQAAVLAAARAYEESPTPANLSRLSAVAEPPRRELLRRLNIAPGATAALVRMREAVLETVKTQPALKALDDDLQHLFASWFNRGFLELKRIDWYSSAVVLEKLIAYEAVHRIDGWEDLRRRLAADRRCFAFFHPALPEEPLIFVQVALVKGIPDQVQPLLDRTTPVRDPKQADTAVFFSISNCQKGLRSVSFGNFLIKQVAAELSAEFANLKTFVTLSPVPGFARWLAQTARKDPDAARIDAELSELAIEDWQNAETVEPWREPVTQLAAWYLTRERNGTMPLDPVARFHLGNGARLERIDWRGDLSAKGLAQSHGIMVNYLYRLDQVERNHETFVNERRVVASSAVDKLAKASLPAKQEAAKPAKPAEAMAS
ncbi:MAG: malonyl-CoA decarboxylase [Pseudomonadota bacterium]